MDLSELRLPAVVYAGGTDAFRTSFFHVGIVVKELIPEIVRGHVQEIHSRNASRFGYVYTGECPDIDSIRRLVGDALYLELLKDQTIDDALLHLDEPRSVTFKRHVCTFIPILEAAGQLHTFSHESTISLLRLGLTDKLKKDVARPLLCARSYPHHTTARKMKARDGRRMASAYSGLSRLIAQDPEEFNKRLGAMVDAIDRGLSIKHSDVQQACEDMAQYFF